MNDNTENGGGIHDGGDSDKNDKVSQPRRSTPMHHNGIVAPAAGCKGVQQRIRT